MSIGDIYMCKVNKSMHVPERTLLPYKPFESHQGCETLEKDFVNLKGL